jgi:hypothetical protein
MDRGTSIHAGQVWRSKRLADYRVQLLHPIRSALYDDVWAVEPSGSSAHGRYVERELLLLDPDAYELIEESVNAPL